MYVIVWEYSVVAEAEGEFERAYGAGGTWATFFGESPHYLGTELLRSVEDDSYWTIDRWSSREAYEQFLEEHSGEYERIDNSCAQLTETELVIGRFELL
jgi:heme-degrading monooxygenase HmoA